MGKNAWAVAEEVCLRIDDSSATGIYFSIFGWPTRKSIFLQLWVLERVSWSHQQSKEFLSGVWVFFQARTIWEPPLWERRAIYGLIGECRVKSEMANHVNFARRMRLPALLFQLGDHIPTMASYQTSIISLGVQPPPMTLSWANTSLELRLSDCLRKLVSQWGQCGY